MDLDRVFALAHLDLRRPERRGVGQRAAAAANFGADGNAVLASRVMQFEGSVELKSGPCGGEGFTLVGRERGRTEEPLHLSLLCAVPPGLPARLDSPRVDLGAEGTRIVVGDAAWEIAPRAVFVHRDVGRAFCSAVPGEPAPAAKRLFWRLLLALASSRPGRAWLARRGGS